MRILTIGLGHCGGKIANDFKKMAMERKDLIVDVCAINTDRADMATHRQIPEGQKLLIGTGKGAAKNWKEGWEAAAQARSNIRELIRRLLMPDTDIVLITAGEGGGSGSGIAPLAAELIGELGRTCISIVTLPLENESVKTKVNAAMGLDLLYRREALKALICIDNDKITAHFPDKTVTEAYERVNRSAVGAFFGLLELAHKPSRADRIDESELSAIFEYPGFATLANFKTQANLVEDLAAMLRHSWNSSLLADVDPATAAGALFGIQGPKHLFVTTQVDAVRRTFREALVGRDAMLGVYPVERSRWVTYVGILTGMDVPRKVSKLLGVAKEEYRLHEAILEERRKMKRKGLGFKLGLGKPTPPSEPVKRVSSAVEMGKRLEEAKLWSKTHRKEVGPLLEEAFRCLQTLSGRTYALDKLVELLQDELSVEEQLVLATIIALKSQGYLLETKENVFQVL